MFDEIQIIENIQKLNLNNIMKLLSQPFNSISFIILLLLFHKYKLLNQNDIIKLAFSSMITILIKVIIQRERPYKSSTRVQNLSNSTHSSLSEKYSFPSGHTQTATVLALILLRKYPNDNFLKIMPFMVGLSRVFLGVHYPTDIIGGMIMGYLYDKYY
uniref:Phosphatidic acid phosphatase type 2/haloperoxidase domain-containing protein n=1 Tax=viral metagenome TaxID=1070528 RepID=A0A6C0J3T2_9ZZZZ